MKKQILLLTLLISGISQLNADIINLNYPRLSQQGQAPAKLRAEELAKTETQLLNLTILPIIVSLYNYVMDNANSEVVSKLYNGDQEKIECFKTLLHDYLNPKSPNWNNTVAVVVEQALPGLLNAVTNNRLILNMINKK